MGAEATCRARFKGAVSDGKALLETDGLIFRGGFRLAIPYRHITRVDASDGTLTVRSPQGVAAFELGEKATAWAEKIRNPKGLIDKLGVKPGDRVCVLGLAGDGFVAELRARGAHVSLRRRKDADAIFAGLEGPADLRKLAPLKQAIRRDGAVWAVYPKGRRDITENDVLAAGKAAGLVDTKVVRFSATHTALKFVIRRADR